MKSGPRLDYSDWIDAYLEGKSFATNAPMVTFTVNGQEAGSELKWKKGTLQVTVEAEAESHVPMSSIELVVNGQVVETEKARKDGTRVRFEEGA